MIRRSFRFGLALGILGGLAAALAKVLGTRNDPITAPAARAPSAPWPPLVVDEGGRPASPPLRTPLTPATGARPDAPAVAEDDPAAELDLVLPYESRAAAEPVAVEPVAPPSPAPAATPPAAPAPASRPRKAPLKATAPAPTPAPAVKRSASAKKAAPPAEAPAPAPAAPAEQAAKAPAKKASTRATPAVAWVEPLGDVCPTTHPVKGKMASLIFHMPGGLSYGRTRPDRCYLDASAAEADGLRPAKR